MSCDAATAIAEIESVIFGKEGVRPGKAHLPQTLFAIEGRIGRILDLCDRDNVSALETDPEELHGEFRLAQKRFMRGEAPMPPTQRLGRAAYRSQRITGIRYPAQKRDGGINLVVFTKRLDEGKGDRLEVVSGMKRLHQRLP